MPWVRLSPFNRYQTVVNVLRLGSFPFFSQIHIPFWPLVPFPWIWAKVIASSSVVSVYWSRVVLQCLLSSCGASRRYFSRQFCWCLSTVFTFSSVSHQLLSSLEVRECIYIQSPRPPVNLPFFVLFFPLCSDFFIKNAPQFTFICLTPPPPKDHLIPPPHRRPNFCVLRPYNLLKPKYLLFVCSWLKLS